MKKKLVIFPSGVAQQISCYKEGWLIRGGWGGLIEDLWCDFLFPIIEQANLGMIFSPQTSVGKSLPAKMLAYAQGVQGLKHNQLLAGGDQVMSGVSS